MSDLRSLTLSRLLLTGLLASTGVPAPLAAQDSVQRYRAIPELTIGDIDGPLPLTAVGSIAVMGSQVPASQPSERVVRVFDAATGRLVQEWRSTGEGPGEMRALSWMGVLGESVLAGGGSERHGDHHGRGARWGHPPGPSRRPPLGLPPGSHLRRHHRRPASTGGDGKLAAVALPWGAHSLDGRKGAACTHFATCSEP